LIVSHEHRFIFVKTRKTAGTSVEVLLSALAGEDAIVTPVEPAEPGHEPRHWRSGFNPFPELVDRHVRHEPSLQDWRTISTLSHLRRRTAYVNHLPASVIRARLGRKVWDRYFTFCFERNPWDKVVSMYFYATRGSSRRPSLEQWIDSVQLRSDWYLYAIRGVVGVDFVGQYDRLDQDLAHALKEVGITDLPELPRAKGQHRSRDQETVITADADRRVRDVFAQEIRYFGYTRPEGSGTSAHP
jgi:hypothetical protein